MIVCAAPAYLQRAGTPARPEDLAGACLAFRWPQARGFARGRPAAARAAAPVEVDMPVALQSASFERALPRRAGGRRHRGAVDARWWRRTWRAAHWCTLLPEWIFGRFTIYAALPSRKLMPARTRAFLDFAWRSPLAIAIRRSRSGARPRTPSPRPRSTGSGCAGLRASAGAGAAAARSCSRSAGARPRVSEPNTSQSPGWKRDVVHRARAARREREHARRRRAARRRASACQLAWRRTSAYS